MAVATRNLTKRYGEVTAVDEVTLTVQQGEVYGFLGPNGAGKTTTLRMLLGLIRPTAGSVEVLGGPPGVPERLARVGSLVESPGFYPYLSGRDNLMVVATYAGVGSDRVAVVLDTVDLTERAGDRFSAYSLGMKQRLGVAAALLKDPEVLILDEPTNGLDPAGMGEMRRLIQRLGSQGCTVLLSSHLLGEVEQVCDRVGVISRGRLLVENTVAQLRGERALLVTAEPLDRARHVVGRMLGPDCVHAVGDALRLDTGTTQSADVVTELVRHEVAVHEVRRVERTLEEVFLEMTGERSGRDVG